MRRYVVTCDECKTALADNNHDWLTVRAEPHPYGPLLPRGPVDYCGPCAKALGLADRLCQGRRA